MTRATNSDAWKANGFRGSLEADDANWYDALTANGFK